jgi:hypothetical protein
MAVGHLVRHGVEWLIRVFALTGTPPPGYLAKVF